MIVRSLIGCKKRPLEGLKHPLVIVGATLSVRFTVKEHEAVLFLTSLVVKTTVIDPDPEREVPAMGDCEYVGV